MRVGIDGRVFQGRRTGIGRYVFELCRKLDTMLPKAEFFVYSQVPIEMPVLSKRWISRIDPHPLGKYLKPIMWLKIRAAIMCKEDNLDVFWGGATFLPQLPHNVRTVVTVYDINFEIVPETMGVTHRWANKMFFKKDIRRANIVLTISQGTSQRLHRLMGRKADAVILPGVGHEFAPQNQQIVQSCMDRYNIRTRYILAVATWEPRKNLEKLIKTFRQMKNENLLSGFSLVLVGGRGWKDRKLLSIISKDNVTDIIPLGYVADKDLPSLYTGAEVFVFPSIYEGFGMPVLEARACGARIVTSNIPELREAGGEDAIYISPNCEGIRNGILTSLSNSSQKKELSLSTWESGAGVLAALLKGQFSSI